MSANKGLFSKYPNPVFIETGSFEGDGIQQALDEGFKTVYSIEINTWWFFHCIDRFKDNPGVRIIQGDSAIMLERLLKIINKPVTFWLDGHVGADSTPLLKELEIIKNHTIKTHTILIDDLRDWNIKHHTFDTEILKTKLLEINPNYTFILEDGYAPKDILVARI